MCFGVVERNLDTLAMNPAYEPCLLHYEKVFNLLTEGDQDRPTL